MSCDTRRISGSAINFLQWSHFDFRFTYYEIWAFHKKVILKRKKRMRTTENDASQKITSFRETFDHGGKIQAEKLSLFDPK